MKRDFNKYGIPTFEYMIQIAPDGVVELLKKCEDTPQSPEWHPEGNVLIHTKIVYDRAQSTGDINLTLAALFHDLGKPTTTKLNKKGTWGAYGHEFHSAKVVDTYRSWIEHLGGDFDTVKGIVTGHMRIKYISDMRKFKQDEMKNSPVYDDLVKFTGFDNMKTVSHNDLKFSNFTLK